MATLHASQRPYLHPSQRALQMHQIGTSSHKNRYKHNAVLEGNWCEDQAIARLPQGTTVSAFESDTEHRTRFKKAPDVLYERGLGLCSAQPRGSHREAVEQASVAHNTMLLPPRTEPTQKELLFMHPTPHIVVGRVRPLNKMSTRSCGGSLSASNLTHCAATDPTLFHSRTVLLSPTRRSAQTAVSHLNKTVESVGTAHLSQTWGHPPRGITLTHEEPGAVRLAFGTMGFSSSLYTTSGEYGSWTRANSNQVRHGGTLSPSSFKGLATQKMTQHVPVWNALDHGAPATNASVLPMLKQLEASKNNLSSGPLQPLRMLYNPKAQYAFDHTIFHRRNLLDDKRSKWDQDRDVFEQQFITTKNATLDQNVEHSTDSAQMHTAAGSVPVESSWAEHRRRGQEAGGEAWWKRAPAGKKSMSDRPAVSVDDMAAQSETTKNTRCTRFTRSNQTPQPQLRWPA